MHSLGCKAGMTSDVRTCQEPMGIGRAPIAPQVFPHCIFKLPTKKRMSKKSDYKLRNQSYLEELSREEGIVKLPKGILCRVLQSGPADGRQPNVRSVVCVHYTGRLINGRVFDDTRRDGVPAAFRLMEVITGWQIALSRMHVGDRWEIIIPADMGYGSRGDSEIPGNSTLIFDVELLSVA